MRVEALELPASKRTTARFSYVFSRVFPFPVMLAGLLAGAVFCSTRLGLQDPDTWWHVATGERILTTRTWPRVDPFSFTVAGHAWLPYEWFGEVVMAVCARLGGIQGLAAGVMVLASAFIILVYYYASLRSGNAKAAFLATAAMLPLSVVFFTFRPQLLGYVFFALVLVLLERYRQGLQKSLWALPVIFLFWVNTHGSFVFGLVALGAYWAGGWFDFQMGGLESRKWSSSQNRHLILVGALSLAALCLTPYGIRVAINPIQMAMAQPVNVANIQEWQSMPFGIWRGKLFLAFVLLFLFAQLTLRPRYRLHELALFLFAVYAACVHVRFLVIFVVFFAPLLATILSRWAPGYDRSQDRPLLNASLLALVAVVWIAFFPSRQALEKTAGDFFPIQAVQYLRAHPVAGPMFNEYGFGGYLIWSFVGRHKVFIDGRADIYEAGGVLSDYLRISRLDPATLALLQKYDIRSCLIRRDAPLGTLLSALPGWQRVYSDHLSALYVLAPPSRAAE